MLSAILFWSNPLKIFLKLSYQRLCKMENRMAPIYLHFAMNNKKSNTQYTSHAGQARWIESTTCQNRVFGEEASSAIVGRFFCLHVL